MANGDNLPYGPTDLDVVPFTPITSDWGDGVASDILALAAGTGLDNESVTPDKLGTGADSSVVATSQTTTSTTYADLATVGPSVTVDIGANGLALVFFKVRGGVSGTPIGQGWLASFSMSGANTLAANDANGTGSVFLDTTGDIEVASETLLLKGLNPGTTTFKLQYRVSGAVTGTFSDRSIGVLPL